MGTVRQVRDIVTSDYSHKIKRNMTNDYMTNDYMTKGETKHIATKRNKQKYSATLARERAGYLARKLKNPSRWMFYLKCAWNLTDFYLDNLLEIALNKDDPIRYFSKAASAEMRANS